MRTFFYVYLPIEDIRMSGGFWNGMSSQIHTKFGYFWKKKFWKKVDFFFGIGKGGKFAVECLSNDSISFSTLIMIFFAKNQKFFNLEKLENLMEYFLKKKTLSSFWKASSTKLESGKYASGSRPSCYIYVVVIIKQIAVNFEKIRHIYSIFDP